LREVFPLFPLFPPEKHIIRQANTKQAEIKNARFDFACNDRRFFRPAVSQKNFSGDEPETPKAKRTRWKI
jgi:hypothetical protein